MLLVALVAGTARAANFWNLPAMAILLVVGGAFAATRGARLPSRGQALLGPASGFGGLRCVSLVLFYPYTASFRLAQRGLGATTMFSEILEFLGVWGILLAVALLGLWPRPSDDSEGAKRRRDLGLAVAAAVSLVCGFALHRPVLAIVLFFSLLAAAAAWKSLRAPDDDAEGVFAAFLVLLALGMIGGCEFVYFKDTYGQDLQRMNTIFKFYHQAWPLLAIGSRGFRRARVGASARDAASASAPRSRSWRCSPCSGPSTSSSRASARRTARSRSTPTARSSGATRATPPSSTGSIKNAKVGSVLLEASGDPYSEFARMSSHTGIPTVLGWGNHEGLWRATVAAEDPEVAERLARIKLFYTTPDPRVASETLQRYDVTHVVLGDMERRTYGSNPATGQFPFLFPVFQSGGTTVYAVARPR